MIDGSIFDEDWNCNMGYIIIGVSFGLVGGLFIGGFLLDLFLLGCFVSISLLFYVCFVLVVVVIVLVFLFFKDDW